MQVRRHLFPALLALLALPLAGCEDITGGIVGGGPFDVGVTSGAVPQVSWNGGNAQAVVIAEKDTGVRLWMLTATTAHGFRSPVTYDVPVPDGFGNLLAQEEPEDAPDLESGVEYQAIVTLTTGQQAFRNFSR